MPEQIPLFSNRCSPPCSRPRSPLLGLSPPCSSSPTFLKSPFWPLSAVPSVCPDGKEAAHADIRIAFIGAIPLVLGESYLILTFLTRTFLIGQAGVDLFDAVSLNLDCSDGE